MTSATSSRRQGYAMVLVLVFIALVNLFFVLSYKHFSSALRVQSARRLGRERDEGPVAALAAGLAFLELTTPTPDGYGYDFRFSIDPDAENDPDAEHYKITFEPPNDPLDEPQRWSVKVERMEWENLDSNWPNLRKEIKQLPEVIKTAKDAFGEIDQESVFDSGSPYPIDIPIDGEPEYHVIFTPDAEDPESEPPYKWRVTVKPAS